MTANRPKPWSKTTLGQALPIRYGKARTDKAGVVREDSAVYGSSGVIDKFDRALTAGATLVIGRKGNVGAGSPTLAETMGRCERAAETGCGEEVEDAQASGHGSVLAIDER